ncbi:MAG: creatininase family protein [Prochlorococcus sp.]|mgnify:CR=1 FL=1|nr:creatininase family protein [Prochlorococcaceae cyanobacterium Fu_MAG_50]
MSADARRFDNLSWSKASEAALQKGSTLIWPFGACEQHGPHLPLCTDALFAEVISARVLERLPPDDPIWMLPAQSMGFSPEHRAFPGTISLSAGLLIQLVAEVGQQLAGMGVQRLLLFNAHGGQIGLLQVAARQLRAQSPSMAVLPCFLWSGVDAIRDLIPADELNFGLHASLAETSLMLDLAPELVGDERPVDGDHATALSKATPPQGWSLEGHAPCAWLSEDLSENGVIGDCSGASQALGQALQQALTDHWVALLKSLMASEWPPVKSLLG